MIWLSSNFIMYGIQNKQKIFLLSYVQKNLDICLINLWDINFCIREKWRFVSLLTKFRVNNNSEMAPSRLDRYQKCTMLKAVWKISEFFQNFEKLRHCVYNLLTTFNFDEILTLYFYFWWFFFHLLLYLLQISMEVPTIIFLWRPWLSKKAWIYWRPLDFLVTLVTTAYITKVSSYDLDHIPRLLRPFLRPLCPKTVLNVGLKSNWRLTKNCGACCQSLNWL